MNCSYHQEIVIFNNTNDKRTNPCLPFPISSFSSHPPAHTLYIQTNTIGQQWDNDNSNKKRVTFPCCPFHSISNQQQTRKWSTINVLNQRLSPTAWYQHHCFCRSVIIVLVLSTQSLHFARLQLIVCWLNAFGNQHVCSCDHKVIIARDHKVLVNFWSGRRVEQSSFMMKLLFRLLGFIRLL